MTRLLVVIACSALLCGCGGSSGAARVTEAQVGFKPPLLLSAVLEISHRHHVRPTELTTEFPLLGETISSSTIVDEGMSNEEIVRRLRESATDMTEGMEDSMLSGFQKANLREAQRRLRTRPLRIDRMIASGTADDLRALEEEPGVQRVFVKPENLPYQR